MADFGPPGLFCFLPKYLLDVDARARAPSCAPHAAVAACPSRPARIKRVRLTGTPRRAEYQGGLAGNIACASSIADVLEQLVISAH